MKRIAFVAAAALLGTGCVVSSDSPPPVGSVNLYWSFQKFAPAQTSGHIDYDTTYVGANGRCPESAVDEVTVDSPVGQTTVACVHAGVQGLGIDGIPAGTQTFRVRGYRGADLVYDTSVNLQVVAGTTSNTASSYYVAVEGTWARLEAFAYLSFAPNTYYATCASALFPTVDYDVYDIYGNAVITGSVLCQDPATGFPVIGEDLDLDNYTIRMTGWTGSPAVRTFDSCASDALKLLAFDHFGAQTGVGGLAVTLDTPPACTL